MLKNRNRYSGPATEWLRAALAKTAADAVPRTPPAPAFAARCREAAETGLYLLKLQQEQVRVGPRLLPLLPYLEGLARLARVSLAPVLARFEIDARETVDSKAASRMGLLCKAIGIDLEQAIVHVRLAVAEAAGHRMEPCTVLARQSAGRTLGANRGGLSRALREGEGALSTAELMESAACEAAVRAVYSKEPS